MILIKSQLQVIFVLFLSWIIESTSAFALLRPHPKKIKTIKTTVPAQPIIEKTALSFANDNQDDHHFCHEEVTLPIFLRPLDLNGDGKLDKKDLEVFQNNVIDWLDINGDGKLDENDVLRGFQLVVFWWMLTLSPAGAKGGGHGGGGGGGGGYHGGGGGYHSSHSSYSGSSYSTYPSHHYYPPPSRPSYYRKRFLGRNDKYARLFDPKACPNLPGEEEHVDVIFPPQSSYSHQTGVVDFVDEKKCSLEVNFPEETLLPPRTLQSEPTWVDWLLHSEDSPLAAILFYGGPFLASMVPVNSLCDHAFDMDFERDLKEALYGESTTLNETSIPKSGGYIGSTQESDGANQTVLVNLNFKEKTMKITGSGYDTDDGKYSVEGEWVGNKVKWIETYHDDGLPFTVVVRGHVNNNDGKINCNFVSSRNVRGTFTIRRRWLKHVASS